MGADKTPCKGSRTVVKITPKQSGQTTPKENVLSPPKQQAEVNKPP